MFTIKIAPLIKGSTLAGAVASIVACSIDPPIAEIAYAEATVQSAINVGANLYADIELESAKGKLYEAKLAMKEGNNDKALRLAQEATVTASSAQEKSELSKSRDRNNSNK